MKEQEQKIMALEEHLHALGGASRAHEEMVQGRGGLATAAKKAGRVAAEGLVAIQANCLANPGGDPGP